MRLPNTSMIWPLRPSILCSWFKAGTKSVKISVNDFYPAATKQNGLVAAGFFLFYFFLQIHPYK